MNQTQPRVNHPDRHAAESSGAVTEGESQAPAQAGAVATPRVDDEWRRWIAENLLLEATPQSVIEAMVAGGISRQEADYETNLALKSPYIRGSELLRTRLKKRDWQLATYRKLNRLDPRSGVIERRHRLSRGEFLAGYYSTNRPVIITGMMDDWPAMAKWSLDYFAERLGDRQVEVQMGREAGDNYEIEREKFIATMKFSEFIEKVRSAGVTNDFYLTANNNFTNKEVMAELWDDIIQIPEYLNGQDRLSRLLLARSRRHDHAVPPRPDQQLHGAGDGPEAGQDRAVVGHPAHAQSFPLLFEDRWPRPSPRAHPSIQEPQILECILGPGEILFLPIGCMHFVEGIDISVTVSFINFLFDNDFASFYSTYHAV